MALTTDGVTSLNGLTGALNGLTFISTTSIANGSATTDVIDIPSGYSQIFFAIDFSLNTTSSGTSPSLRISTNNGSSYIATGYIDIDGANNVAYILGSTGTGTSAPRFYRYGYISQPTSAATLTAIYASGGSLSGGGFYGVNSGNTYTIGNSSYVNAIQLLRPFGTRLFTGGSITLWGQK